MEVLKKSLVEIRDLIKTGDISSEAVTSACIEQTKKLNPEINAFITVNEHALEQAHQADKQHKAGEDLGLLGGVPVAVKDLLCKRGMLTTAGSKILKGFVPPYSSTVVSKLEGAGSITFGKTNLDEFAMGSSNETSAYGPCRNPWNPDYVPGGSSGGSAAAVSGFMVPAAIGTDTGGSIRQPASFCGIVGLKPTYGRVSRYGIVAFASSLDQAGPMTKTVKDAALIAQVISGQDKMDQTTAEVDVPNWLDNINSDVSGKTIGLPKEYFEEGSMSADVRKKVETTIEALKNKGAKFKEVSIPSIPTSVPIYYLICTSEASSNLARYDGVRFGHRADFSKKPAESTAEFYSRTRGEGFGEEVKRRILMGTFSLSSGYYDAYYAKACKVRRLLRDEFLAAFNDVDVILGPVTTSTSFKIGERIEDPFEMYNNDIFTTAANLAGLPGISVPIGLGDNNLPIGVQLLGKHFDEQSILDVGQCVENEIKFTEHANVL